MWMGIDVGTGGTRALVVDAQGRVAAGCTAAHEDIRRIEKATLGNEAGLFGAACLPWVEVKLKADG